MKKEIVRERGVHETKPNQKDKTSTEYITLDYLLSHQLVI